MYYVVDFVCKGNGPTSSPLIVSEQCNGQWSGAGAHEQFQTNQKELRITFALLVTPIRNKAKFERWDFAE
eukprot:scaffold30215_cov148-Skeletonema_menzelii.AAC.5